MRRTLLSTGPTAPPRQGRLLVIIGHKIPTPNTVDRSAEIAKPRSSKTQDLNRANGRQLMAEDDSYWATYPDILTVAEVAKILRVKKPSVFLRLKNGTIPAHQISGSWIIFKAEVRAWLDSTSNQAASNVPAEVDVLDSYPDELSYRDLMVLFGKTKQTIYAWLHNGDIVGSDIGGRWVVLKAQLRQQLRLSSNQPGVSD
jgi:excisionase family DNA binding protein